MKMITAIVNRLDGGDVCRALSQKGYMFTRVASVGGFLRAGNVTLLIGVEDGQVEDVLALIRHNCSQRKVQLPTSVHNDFNFISNVATTEVTVGGATVFVSSVERWEKM